MTDDDILKELGLDEPAKTQPKKIATVAATTQCPYCAETILADAIKCKHCGEFVSRAERNRRELASRKPEFSSGTAAVLSFVIPGAGQIYKGQIGNGMAWLLVVAIGYAAFVVPGIILHILCIYGASRK